MKFNFFWWKNQKKEGLEYIKNFQNRISGAEDEHIRVILKFFKDR